MTFQGRISYTPVEGRYGFITPVEDSAARLIGKLNARGNIYFSFQNYDSDEISWQQLVQFDIFFGCYGTWVATNVKAVDDHGSHDIVSDNQKIAIANSKNEEKIDSLLMDLKQDQQFITISCDTFNPLKVSINCNTISQLKNIIKSKWDFVAFTLHHKKRELYSDTASLKDYNIKSYETIRCIQSNRKPLSYDEYQKQLLQESMNEGNQTISQMSEKIDNLNKKFKKTENRIKTASSLFELDEIRSCLTEKTNQQILNCREPADINKSIKRMNGIQNEISRIRGCALSDLNENTMSHNSKLKELQKELSECDKEMNLLEAKKLMIQKRTETTKEAIYECHESCSEKKKKTNESINSIQTKIDEVSRAYHNLLQNTQHNETLLELITDKIEEFETSWYEWTVNDIVVWVRNIENKYFDVITFKSFFDKLHELNVGGRQLKEMNNKLFLEMTGLDIKSQSVLMRNIGRISSYENVSGNRNHCGFCTQNIINSVILPCGHQYACYACSKKGKISKCPLCRKDITQIIKTYMQGF